MVFTRCLLARTFIIVSQHGAIIGMRTVFDQKFRPLSRGLPAQVGDPLFCNDYRYVMLRLVHMGNYRYNAGDQAVFGKGLRSENADPSAASKVTAAS